MFLLSLKHEVIMQYIIVIQLSWIVYLLSSISYSVKYPVVIAVDSLTKDKTNE